MIQELDEKNKDKYIEIKKQQDGGMRKIKQEVTLKTQRWKKYLSERDNENYTK